MLAARVEPKNAPQESEKSDNFKPLVFREFRAGVDTVQDGSWRRLGEPLKSPAVFRVYILLKIWEEK